MKTRMLAITVLATAFAIPAFAQSAATDPATMPATSSPVQAAAAPVATPGAPGGVPTAAAPAVAKAPTTEARIATEGPAAPSPKPVTEIVTRGANGQADMVKVNGEDYRVCKGEVRDGCINPRSAGLNFGARDLQYWPGRPASEIDTPLPAEEASGG